MVLIFTGLGRLEAVIGSANVNKDHSKQHPIGKGEFV